MLKKTLVLVLTLTIVYFAESSPINHGSPDFDNFGVDYADLGYERDDPIWGSYLFKLFEDITRKPPKEPKASKNNKESSVKESGSKKKNKSTKDVLNTHSSGDLNSFFKNADAYDRGHYDDSDAYGKAAATAAAAAVTNGKETRTYARGNKTTGFHRVHHKDEYKKDQEFYEQDETKGTINKAGVKALGTRVDAGTDFETGNFNHDRYRGSHGRQGNFDLRFSNKQISDFADSEDNYPDQPNKRF